MSDLEAIHSAIEALALPTDFDDLFGRIWDPSTLRFNTQETYILDFKETIPANFKDPYGAGLVRLALAFYNSYGGFIIFGVKDRTQNVVGANDLFDIENFNRILSDITACTIQCLAKRIRVPIAGDPQITVVLVPKRGIALPAKLVRDFGPYKKGTCWIRERHEALVAADRHLPHIYSARGRPPDMIDDTPRHPVHRSLPPSPATLHRFVSRHELLESLWQWFVLGDQPRLYLDGPGGSGKSTLAFEFARTLAETGSEIRGPRGDRLDYVVFISGKETEYNTQSAVEQTYVLRQFASATEQFAQILHHSGFLSSTEVESASPERVEELLTELFENFSGLIVIDDIDALTRRKVDTGEEELLIKAVRSAKKTRILYTLRQPPTHAKKSAIAVPGLDSETELHPFIAACCEQFGSPVPSLKNTENIESATNKLPLLIETIIWSRKFSGDYNEAIRAFKERSGDGARRYLYQREYDRLNQDGKSRQLLAGISLIGEPIGFATLSNLFQFTRDQLIEAISECSEVFLVPDENTNGETLYQLSAPSIPFVQSVSKGISHYEALKRKVEHLKSIDVRMSPREAAILVTLEAAIRKRDYASIADICEAIPIGDISLENPRIRAIMGRAYVSLGNDHREKARQCFRHAEGLQHLDIPMLRSWFFMEFTSGYNLTEAERICRLVIDHPTMSLRFKSEFWNKLGSCFHQRSFSFIGVNRERAFELLRASISAYLTSIRIARSQQMNVSEPLAWIEKPIRQFVTWVSSDFDQLFDLLEQLSDAPDDVDEEAIQVFLRFFLLAPAPRQKRQRERLKGLCLRAINRIGRNKRPLDSFPGFERVVVTLEALRDKLEEIARPQ